MSVMGGRGLSVSCSLSPSLGVSLRWVLRHRIPSPCSPAQTCRKTPYKFSWHSSDLRGVWKSHISHQRWSCKYSLCAVNTGLTLAPHSCPLCACHLAEEIYLLPWKIPAPRQAARHDPASQHLAACCCCLFSLLHTHTHTHTLLWLSSWEQESPWENYTKTYTPLSYQFFLGGEFENDLHLISFFFLLSWILFCLTEFLLF